MSTRWSLSGPGGKVRGGRRQDVYENGKPSQRPSQRLTRGWLTRPWVRADNEMDGLRPPPPLRRPSTLAPSLLLRKEDAVEAQLKALQHNNFPTLDHGIEVLYKFSGFDPWQRSSYFGRSLDLGKSLCVRVRVCVCFCSQ